MQSSGSDAAEIAADQCARPARIGILGIIFLTAFALIDYRYGQSHERLVKIVVAAMVCVPIHLLPFIVLGHIAKLEVQHIGIYFGGAIARWKAANVWWSIGWMPMGGYVKFATLGQTALKPNAWYRLHPVLRAMFILSGPASVLLLACALLGPSTCLTFVREAPEKILRSAQHQQLVRQFFAFVDQASFPEVIGAVALIFSAINLLPLPVVNGGQAIIELLKWPLGDKITPKIEQIASMIGLLILLSLVLLVVYSLPDTWPTK